MTDPFSEAEVAAGSMPPLEGDELLTPQEVARLFRVGKTTILRWAHSGRLPYVKTLGGQRRFRADDIQKVFAEAKGLAGPIQDDADWVEVRAARLRAASQPRGKLRGSARVDVSDQARALYESGRTIRDIAASLDRSYGFVRNILLETGTPLRKHGSHSVSRR